MTFTMSTEGDSVKSGLSEANEKTTNDNHTTDDSSQDSVDSKDVSTAEKPVQNNVAEKDEKPKEDTTEGESDQETSDPKKDSKDTEEPKPEPKKEDGDNDSNAEDKEEKPEVNDVKEAKEEKASSTASEKDDKEEEEPEEEKEDKKGVPLLDQPLETEGKRERKNVQRFEEGKKSEPSKVDFEEGSGTPLGEIPRVEASITRFKNEDLKFLHRLLFKVQGNNKLFKKNIRKFNGFPFDKDSEEYKKKVETLKKAETKVLKTTCEILDLAKTGNKDDLVDRIMEFLIEPKDSGKSKEGGGRPKRASAVRANNRGYSSHDDYSSDERQSRARRDKGKRANLKDDSSSDEEFKPGEASDASEEKPRKRKRGRGKRGSSEEDEASLSEASSDESDFLDSQDAPKSKRRKSITKSNSKSTTKRRGRPSKAAAPTPRSKGKRGRKPKNVSSEEEEDKVDDGSSSEDEPLAKKKVKAAEPPSDDDIKAFIKGVLDGANLEEITMKTVCQRVYDNYPDFDLTARKNFIKSTVKSLIST